MDYTFRDCFRLTPDFYYKWQFNALPLSGSQIVSDRKLAQSYALLGRKLKLILRCLENTTATPRLTLFKLIKKSERCPVYHSLVFARNVRRLTGNAFILSNSTLLSCVKLTRQQLTKHGSFYSGSILNLDEGQLPLCITCLLFELEMSDVRT